MASLKRNFIYDVLNNVTGLLFPLITFPYVSRILNPQGIGEVAFAQSIIAYFVMFAALGIPTYALREVAKYRNNKERLSRFTLEIFIIHASLSIITYIAALSLYFVGKVHEIWIIYLISSSSIILNFLGFSWFFQGVEEFRFITVRVLIFRILSLAALFAFVHASTDVYWYVGILIFSEVGNNVCNIFKLRNYISFKGIRFDELHFKRHFRPIINLFLLSVSTLIYFNLDNLMIGFIKDDVAVGYYNPALRIQRMLMGLVLSLGTVLFPRLSNLADNDRQQFLNLGRQGFNATLGLSLPILFGVFALGQPLILLFAGAKFEPSILTLYLLAPVIVMGTCSNLIAKMLISQNKEKVVLIATSAGAIVNLALNALFITLFSQFGAAAASSISELAVLLTMIIVGYKLLPRPLFTVDALKYLAAAVVMWISISCVNPILHLPDYAKCIVGFIIGVSSYFIMLLLLKERFVTRNILKLCQRHRKA